jgi:FkbM family methyltransferase
VSEVVAGSAPKWVRLAARLIPWLPAGRYRAISRLGRNPPPTFRMRMPSSMGGQWFLCDLRDSIAREVCFTGLYEPQETAVVRAVLKPGMTFVDVGANWGYFTLLAAHLVGRAGRVLSLEPDPRLFQTLSSNLAMNRLDQVRALQLAAADAPGLLNLAGFDERQGNFGLSRIVEKGDIHLFGDGHADVAKPVPGTGMGAGTDGCRIFPVAARPLDHVLAEAGIDGIDLLKMDIEGAEGMALKGMQETLSRRRVRRLLLELHPSQLQEHGQSAAEIIGQLQEWGYVGWRIDHSPKRNRRAAYRRTTSIGDILRPLEPHRVLDRWPHLLWVSPETERAW